MGELWPTLSANVAMHEGFPALSKTIAIPTGTTIANFADNLQLPATDYTATINWGDGTALTSGTITGSNGQYVVSSSAVHTYADFGNFTLTVTVVNTANNDATTSMAGTVAVASDEVIGASGDSISGNPNLPFANVQVANFTDTDSAVTAGQLTATITGATARPRRGLSWAAAAHSPLTDRTPMRLVETTPPQSLSRMIFPAQPWAPRRRRPP